MGEPLFAQLRYCLLRSAMLSSIVKAQLETFALTHVTLTFSLNHYLDYPDFR